MDQALPSDRGCIEGWRRVMAGMCETAWMRSQGRLCRKRACNQHCDQQPHSCNTAAPSLAHLQHCATSPCLSNQPQRLQPCVRLPCGGHCCCRRCAQLSGTALLSCRACAASLPLTHVKRGSLGRVWHPADGAGQCSCSWRASLLLGLLRCRRPGQHLPRLGLQVGCQLRVQN